MRLKSSASTQGLSHRLVEVISLNGFLGAQSFDLRGLDFSERPLARFFKLFRQHGLAFQWHTFWLNSVRFLLSVPGFQLCTIKI